ncbi:uncharacterized protein LOC128886314 [Hylaeus anthracinus]|uniref:uncharacterized protein LOC128886314 n=1 Tax=Hylaeus anthracinus TaxID=313031 RepID=UPI0023B941EF|nr:uncharacterized protein LOC128886314 [Hylaeus anthracinus]
MKSLLLTVVCLFLVAAVVRSDSHEANEKFGELMKDHVESCAEEHNISPTDMDKFADINLEGEERKKFGCMKACIMRGMDIMDGTAIKIETVKELIEKVYTDDDIIAKQVKVAEDCIEEVKDKTDECDIGFEFIRCTKIKSKDE